MQGIHNAKAVLVGPDPAPSFPPVKQARKLTQSMPIQVARVLGP
jgi:hypothetical protein